MGDSRVLVRKPILLALCSLITALMLVGVISTTQAFADEQNVDGDSLVIAAASNEAAPAAASVPEAAGASEATVPATQEGAADTAAAQPGNEAPQAGAAKAETPAVDTKPAADAKPAADVKTVETPAQDVKTTETPAQDVAVTGAPAAEETLAAADDPVPYEESHVNMYRLYNPNSGEHFYTASLYEAQSVASAGWRWEGIGWVAPTENDRPVFRLYNPNAGDHHYTLSAFERDSLVNEGWSYEGIGWYSDSEDQIAVFREYNPNAIAGAHNFTTSSAEDEFLGNAGWNREGTAWYATNGEHIAIEGFWLVTNSWGALHRYWIDSDANVAKGRFVETSEGSGWTAYATPEGYVVTGKWDNGAGRVYVADSKGELASTEDGADGWLITGAYDGGTQRYYYDSAARAMISGFFEVDGKRYFGVGGQGYVLRNDYVQDQAGGGQWYHADNDGVLSKSEPPSYAAMIAMAQGYSSGTGYLMMIDNDTCHVGVFTGSEGNWTLEHYWDCANGRDDSPTPRGVFYIGSKGYSFGDDDHTCFYYSQITGNYLFHSILYEPYQSAPRDDNVKFGGLGGHFSNGCVRLATDNAYWVYSNVPGGTKIVSYN